MINFCTLFDSGYLYRGLAMYESLCKYCEDFHLYIFPFDDISRDKLMAMDLPKATIIPLNAFESEELLHIKQTRSRYEYYWTCTPSTILYCLKHYGLTDCTYVDADVYFFASPLVLLEEIGGDSVLITGHRYTPRYDQSRKSGRYCVQFITFRNDEHGLHALNWWRNACNDWCYDRHENGRFGDQQYLDDWPKRFKGVHELRHLGGGVAPWNVQQYNFRKKGNALYGSVKQTQEDFPVIFYHFHRLVFYSEKLLDLGNYVIDKEVLNLVYKPYVEHLLDIQKRISGEGRFSSSHGVISNPASFKNILRLLKRMIFIGQLNIRSVGSFRNG
jgi:hypothetical protein